MTKQNSLQFYCSTASFLILCSATSATLAGPPKPVPFKATVTMTETLTLANGPDGPSCKVAPIAGMTVGTGNASHLGKIAFVSTDCVVKTGTTLSFTEGKLTVTAANGDQLFGTYYGSFQPVGTAPSGLPLYKLFDAKFSFMNGTGRFANARGQGDLNGTEELSETPFNPLTPSKGQLQLDGTISY